MVLGLAWGVLASCGGDETETATKPETETESTTTATAATAPTTTVTVPETTITARSEWCLERDAGRWTEREPEDYDPSFLDAEKAAIQRHLDLLLAQQLQEANTIFDNFLLRTRAGEPAIQADSEADIEESRQRAISGIRAKLQQQFRSAWLRLCPLAPRSQEGPRRPPDGACRDSRAGTPQRNAPIRTGVPVGVGSS